MEENGNDVVGDNKDVLYVAGGLALMVFGAGLIATNPTVRKAVGAGIRGILPELRKGHVPDLATIGADIERYLRLKGM